MISANLSRSTSSSQVSLTINGMLLKKFAHGIVACEKLAKSSVAGVKADATEPSLSLDKPSRQGNAAQPSHKPSLPSIENDMATPDALVDVPSNNTECSIRTLAGDHFVSEVNATLPLRDEVFESNKDWLDIAFEDFDFHNSSINAI